MDPKLIAMLAGGLMQGFSPDPSLPPEVQRYMHMLGQMARGDLRFSRGLPGSSPQEQATLAQASGILGQNIGGQRDQMAAAMGNPETSGNFQNAPDALARFGSNATGQYGALLGQLMQHFMQLRAQARDRAASEFGQAGQLASGPRMQTGTDIGGALGNAAYTWGMMQGMKNPGTKPAVPRTSAPHASFLTPQLTTTGQGDLQGPLMQGGSKAGFMSPQFGTVQPDAAAQSLFGTHRLFGT